MELIRGLWNEIESQLTWKGCLLGDSKGVGTAVVDIDSGPVGGGIGSDDGVRCGVVGVGVTS